MESQEVLESRMVLHNTNGGDDLSVSSLCNNRFKSEEVDFDVKLSEGLNVDLLEDLDTMMEDINNRLRVSRMVSDSVIKGMVNAIEQEANEKIKAKESEFASLKQSLRFHHVNETENESSWLQEICCEPETCDFEEDDSGKFDKMKESLLVLRKFAKEQFKRLKQQLRRTGSCSELVRFGGVSKENECENLVSIDKTVDSLETVIETMCRRVNGMLVFSETSLQEQQLKAEVEATVMQSIRCIEEKFEKELLDCNASLCVNQYVVWSEKLKEISGLRNDLEALKRLLPSSDSGSLLSHTSFDADSAPGKPLNGHLSSQHEENGTSDEAKTDGLETFGVAELNHLNHEDLVKFFNNRISKLKREHESVVQDVTEKYISLKGKYLSERQAVMPHSKDFEILRKKIADVVPKLDKVLVEGDKFPECGNDGESLDILMERLDALLNENRQLRDSLADKKKEVERLSSRHSVASESTLQHNSSKSNIQNSMKTFSLSMTDARIESSITEDMYQCVMGELGAKIKNMKEESEMEIIAMQEIYEVLLKQANVNAKTTIEDSYMEFSFTQGLSKTILEETLKEAEKKYKSLFNEHLTTIENLVSLEKKAVEREAEIRLEVEEREKSRNEVCLLRKVMEEKENIERVLTKVREQFELASDELTDLRKQASWQETLMSKTNKELDEISGNLSKAQEQIDVDKLEITFLNQKLELAMKAVDDLRNWVLALTQEKQSYMSLAEAKEKEHKKQMEAVVVLIDGLSTKFVDFESSVAGEVRRNKMRLECSSSELCSLVKAANDLKRRGLEYKLKLERKCCDLQMAEDEVDLLGDEVETNLSLLEKMYVALDHYSPVLQHYPGVIEILKLIRKELSGESVKAHRGSFQ